MSLATQLIAALQLIGADVKALRAADGSLAALSTTEKSSLVAAINEVLAIAQDAGAINDAAASASSTYSSSKIVSLLASLKSELLGGASAAYDTLKEIEQKLGSEDTAINNLLTAVANRVSFADAQTLTAAQQLQACTNLGVGDPATDFAAAYTTAKA
nr:hypothetical protein [uncultured Pseudogulbenkiania sp.]